MCPGMDPPPHKHLDLAFTAPQLEALEHVEKQDEDTEKPYIPDGVLIYGGTSLRVPQ